MDGNGVADGGVHACCAQVVEQPVTVRGAHLEEMVDMRLSGVGGLDVDGEVLESLPIAARDGGPAAIPLVQARELAREDEGLDDVELAVEADDDGSFCARCPRPRYQRMRS